VRRCNRTPTAQIWHSGAPDAANGDSTLVSVPVAGKGSNTGEAGLAAGSNYQGVFFQTLTSPRHQFQEFGAREFLFHRGSWDECDRAVGLVLLAVGLQRRTS